MSAATTIDSWLRRRLVCPRDHGTLTDEGTMLVCAAGHRYPCVEGIPVMVLDDVRQTHWIAAHSLEEPEADISGNGNNIIDPYVRDAVGATCGNFYGAEFSRTMTQYPIPRLPIAARHTDELLLDVGCNWGRWTFAAARAGFLVVGIDPSLIGIRAARRVAAQLGLRANFIVADARYLPFTAGTFETVFSYSVLQHFAPEDVVTSAREMRRVLVDGGRVAVQMAAMFGLRSLVQLARRKFTRAREFQVRYWPPTKVRRAFDRAVGPARLEADSYFSLNAQAADLPLLAPKHRMIVRLSDRLRRTSAYIPWLVSLADSVYVHATSSRE